jgi:hypothetical protein
MTAGTPLPVTGAAIPPAVPRHKTRGRAGRRASLRQPARNASAARLLRAAVRRGAQEAHSGSKVARARREPAPGPGHRLKPTARSRAAHWHRAATPTPRPGRRPDDRPR